MQNLVLTRPDDWHLHLRDGEALLTSVPDAARRFARALIMPNLRPPVTTVEQAVSYRDRILAAVPEGLKFEPVMTLYLTDNTSVDEIRRASQSGVIRAVKLYPAGATTNSDSGVTSIEKVYPVLECMEELGLVLCIHGEVTHDNVDIFDRESVFIERVLAPLAQRFPRLRTVFEHITTRQAAEYVSSAGEQVAATITAHHLLLNRNALLAGGIRPHHYCLPILKREEHRQALLKVATSGHPRFFLGTDSAPHAQGAKEAPCGCAGCYTAHAAVELYAEAFESVGALDRLEGFAAFHGADWYGLPRSLEKVTLVKEDWTVPARYAYQSGESLVPLRAGETVAWRIFEES